MKNLFITGAFITLFLGCKGTKQISKEIINAKDIISLSINHHDPKENWNQLDTDITFKTQFWNKEGGIDLSSSSISFDNANEIFTSTNGQEDIEIKGYVSLDTCYTSTNTELTEEQAEKLKKSLSCDNIIFFRDYYSYLIGMPMKLQDDAAIVNDTIFEREYAGKKYDVVKVTYEPLDKNPVWYFYFDKDDHSFQLCKFTSRENENKGGEYIIYNQPKVIQGVKLYEQQVWLYNTPTLDTLAVEDLDFRE